MRKLVFIFLLLSTSVASAEEKDSKMLDNAIITKLASSYEFGTEPGLYEVISKKTGNTIYLYIDRAGNVEIATINHSNK